MYPRLGTSALVSAVFTLVPNNFCRISVCLFFLEILFGVCKRIGQLLRKPIVYRLVLKFAGRLLQVADLTFDVICSVTSVEVATRRVCESFLRRLVTWA